MQIIHDFDRKPKLSRDDLAGLTRAPIRTGDHQVRLEANGDAPGGVESLLAPQVGNRHLGRAGETSIAISFALAVPDHDQFAHKKLAISRRRSWNSPEDPSR